MTGWYLLILIAGVAPDFDFLPGILIGDPNRFHHGPTHSILAGILFTGFIYFIIKPLNLRAALLIFLVYLLIAQLFPLFNNISFIKFLKIYYFWFLYIMGMRFAIINF